jgi:choline dehydrogenase-like flavoprotein
MFLAMVYTRAAASDYDDWEQKFGNKGWASKDLIPLLNKVCVWIHWVPAFFEYGRRLKRINLK